MPDLSRGILLSKRALTLAAIVLSVSLGLCGVNYVGFATLRSHAQAGFILMFTGVLELFGMIVGAVGVIVSGSVSIVLSLIDRSRDDGKPITIFRSDDK